ncbi:hypothetical protein DFR50_12116 [Roseiarcus fermentans]|uniref:Uncharacterized protein n=1 Tax=Roseiarcus fermentans TaxID=1473586 RepID=A0A366F4U9_9HYPH|nr:hypothetical protein DFR50_12116 [Roseiarcus fermentans]
MSYFEFVQTFANVDHDADTKFASPVKIQPLAG